MPRPQRPRSSSIRAARTIALASLLLATTGCGQRGPLYMPSAPAVIPVAPPAPAKDVAPSSNAMPTPSSESVPPAPRRSVLP
ncbi:MAG: LPS translocon maturation chaperone LptM [Burkholderiaceae bacterium]